MRKHREFWREVRKRGLAWLLVCLLVAGIVMPIEYGYANNTESSEEMQPIQEGLEDIVEELSEESESDLISVPPATQTPAPEIADGEPAAELNNTPANEAGDVSEDPENIPDEELGAGNEENGGSTEAAPSKSAPMKKGPLKAAPAPKGIDWAIYDWDSIDWETFDFSVVDWSEVDWFYFDMFSFEDTYMAGTNVSITDEVFEAACIAYLNDSTGIDKYDITPAPSYLGGATTAQSDKYIPVVSLKTGPDKDNLTALGTQSITKDTDLYLEYDWHIETNGHGLTDIGIQTGVKYELAVPTNLILTDTTEEIDDNGKVFAKMSVKEGKVYITFSDVSLLGPNVIAGLKCKISDVKDQYDADKKIKVELGGNNLAEPTVTDFVPDGPKIEKKNKGEIDYTTGIVKWDIAYTKAANNYTYDTNNLPQIEDLLPEEMVYQSFEVTPASAVNTPTKTTEGTKEKLTFQFVGEAYKEDATITVTAKLSDSELLKLMDMGGNAKKGYENNVTLKLPEGDLTDKATQNVEPKNFNFVDKSKDSDGYWVITINTPPLGDAKKLELIDVLGKYLNYVDGTFGVKAKGESEFTNKPITFSSETNGAKKLTYTLWEYSSADTAPKSEYQIRYKTTVDSSLYADSNATDADITNTASVQWTSGSEKNNGNGVSSKGVINPGTSATVIEKIATDMKRKEQGAIFNYKITVNPNAVTLEGSSDKPTILTETLEDNDPKYRPWFFSDENGNPLTEDGIKSKLATALGVDAAYISVTGSNPNNNTQGFSKFEARVTCNITEKKEIAINTMTTSPELWAKNHEDTPMKNVVDLNTTINGAPVSKSANATQDYSTHVLAKYMENFDPTTGYATYKIRIGQNGYKADSKYNWGEVKIKDYLPACMKYVSSDVNCKSELWKGTDENDSKKELIKDNVAVTSYEEHQTGSEGDFSYTDNNIIEWEPLILDSSVASSNGQLYFLYFTVKVDTSVLATIGGKVNAGANIRNNVSVEIQGQKSFAYHNFVVKNNQDLITKQVTRKPGVKALDYRIYVNPYAIDFAQNPSLTSFMIEDTLGGGLMLDVGSVKLYKAKATASIANRYEGNLNYPNLPGQKTEYGDNTITIETGSEVGQSVSGKTILLEKIGDPEAGIIVDYSMNDDGTSTMKVPIENKQAYILEYSVIANDMSNLKNSAKIVGEGMTPIEATDRFYSFSSHAYGSAGRYLPTSLPDNPYYIFSVAKIDAETGNPVGYEEDTDNAEFILYTDDASNPIRTLKCNKDGLGDAMFLKSELQAFLNATPAVKTFHIKETKAPKDYDLAMEVFDLDIDEMLKTTDIDAVTGSYFYTSKVKNKRTTSTADILGEFTIFKQKPDSTFIAGAKFGVYTDETCTNPVVGVSKVNGVERTPLTDISIDNVSGVVVSDIPLGTYYIKEEQAPSGYKAIMSPIKVVVGSFAQNIYVVNEPAGKFQIQKLDEKNQPLLNAKFSVYKEISGVKSAIPLIAKLNGIETELKDFVIDTVDATVQIDDVPYGVYYIEEVEAPSGYQLLASDLRIEVSDTNALSNELYKIVNTKKPSTTPDPPGGIGGDDPDDSSTPETPAPPAKSAVKTDANGNKLGSDGKIPQTGQLWWPVWLMGGLGSLFLILGFLWKPKKKK